MILLKVGLSFLGGYPLNVGDVTPNWIIKSLMFFVIVLYFIFICLQFSYTLSIHYVENLSYKNLNFRRKCIK